MGVKIIQENGRIISGPEYSSSNRPRKSEYNKMIEIESSDHSMGYSVSLQNKNRAQTSRKLNN